MEDCITAISGTKRLAGSPVRTSPVKRSAFVGITPQKEFPFINTPPNRPFRVSIEGNIGAGKSTLLEYFLKSPGIETYPVGKINKILAINNNTHSFRNPFNYGEI